MRGYEKEEGYRYIYYVDYIGGINCNIIKQFIIRGEELKPLNL